MTVPRYEAHSNILTAQVLCHDAGTQAFRVRKMKKRGHTPFPSTIAALRTAKRCLTQILLEMMDKALPTVPQAHQQQKGLYAGKELAA
jgi:hypothetical protein